MSANKKEWRGGARKNAGRPKLSRVEKLVPATVSLSRATLREIDTIALRLAPEKKTRRQIAMRELINAGLAAMVFEKDSTK